MRYAGKIPGALLVWVISYLFFLSTLVTNFSASHDSIHYLIDILNNQHLFHEHHLLYHFLANKWMHLMHVVFPGIDEHFLIESFTSLWGSSALCMVWLFLRNRFNLLAAPAAAGTAVVCFSYGFWFYSVNIEVYLPPLFFVLCCLYILTGKNFRAGDVWKIAILHSLAILFHQVNVLFAPVIIYVFFANRLPLKYWLQYMAIGTIITLGTYFIAGWIIEKHHSFPEWIRWMQGYTVGHGYWQPLSMKTPLHVITGFVHAFIGGHFIFQLPAMEHYLQNSFQTHGLNDEVFLSDKMSYFTARALTGLFVIYSVVFVFLSVRFFANYKKIRSQFGVVVSPLLLCIVVYSVFFCFWMPEILEFWILQMVLVWILLIGTLPVLKLPFKVPMGKGLILLAVIMFSINYFGSIRWLQDLSNDWYYAQVDKIRHGLTSEDVVIVKDEWILKDFIHQYTPVLVIADDEEGYNKNNADESIRRAIQNGKKVYLYKPPSGPAGSFGSWELIRSY
ncbi:MAG: hypothetical protein ABI415_07955 [Flavitalea sp.]